MKKKGHKRLTVTERGLVIQSDLPYLDASPDRFVYYCPQVVENINDYLKLSVLINGICYELQLMTKSFFCYVNSKGKVKLKKTLIYYYQIQGVMALFKLRVCDFVIWTLKGLLVIIQLILTKHSGRSRCFQNLRHFLRKPLCQRF